MRKHATRKRAFRRKRNSRRSFRPSTAISRTTITADRQFVKLQSFFVGNVANGASTGEFAFQANSFFDPQGTAGAEQPAGYDQWKAFYQQYTVYGARIECTLLPTDGFTVPFIWSIHPSLVTSAISTQDTIALPYVRWKSTNYATSAGHHLNGYMATGKIFGEPSSTINSDDRYSADIAATPVNVWYWRISWSSSDASTLPAGRIMIKLVQYGEFHKRAQVADV